MTLNYSISNIIHIVLLGEITNIIYPFPGLKILNALNSRPELAELENHVRTNISSPTTWPSQ